MLGYTDMEALVLEDFETFNHNGKKIVGLHTYYFYKKHIQMAAQLTEQRFGKFKPEFSKRTDVKDFIHGLNHLFFFGVAAGDNLHK